MAKPEIVIDPKYREIINETCRRLQTASFAGRNERSNREQEEQLESCNQKSSESFTDKENCPTDKSESGPAKDTAESAEYPMIKLYDRAKADAQRSELNVRQGSSLDFWFEKLLEEGADNRQLKVPSDQEVNAVTALTDRFPNFRTPLEIIAGATQLAAKTQTAVKIPNLLLDGEPGSGKTELVRQLAAELKLPLITISMGILDGRFELAGLNRGYRDPTIGLLARGLIEHDIGNPLFLFDEAENGNPEIYQALLQFIEDSSFRDHCLQLDFNVKHVNIVFITNDKTGLSAPLRSRLVEVDIQQPSLAEREKITANIFENLRQSSLQFSTFSDALPSQVIQAVSHLPLRQVRQALELGLYRAAARSKDNHDLCITPEDITTILPLPRRSIGFINTDRH